MGGVLLNGRWSPFARGKSPVSMLSLGNCCPLSYLPSIRELSVVLLSDLLPSFSEVSGPLWRTLYGTLSESPKTATISHFGACSMLPGPGSLPLLFPGSLLCLFYCAPLSKPDKHLWKLCSAVFWSTALVILSAVIPKSNFCFLTYLLIGFWGYKLNDSPIQSNNYSITDSMYYFRIHCNW